MAFVHTEVEDVVEGHGVGSMVIREALEDARRRDFEVLPFCPFVNSFIAEHRECVDLFPGSRRVTFGSLLVWAVVDPHGHDHRGTARPGTRRTLRTVLGRLVEATRWASF
jgi:GCN5-related N-acetyl-transferase